MLMPYLQFEGNCEEALRFYAASFGGEVQHMARYGELPAEVAATLPDEQKALVMHAQVSLPLAGGQVSGADSLQPVTRGNTVSLQAHMNSADEAEQVFAALAKGGAVVSALAPNPPPDAAGLSGCVEDRFGFTWIVSALR